MPVLQLKVRIAYRKDGQGAPVMLLHGFGEDGSIWKHQAAKLAHAYQVVCPDLPGCGLSENMFQYDPAPTMEKLADLVAAIADAESWNTFTLLGHSMGGYVTLAFAEKNPQRLNGFGLIHSTAFADSAEKKEIRKKSISFIQANGTQAFMETMIPGLYSETFRNLHIEIVREHIRESEGYRKEVLIAWYQMMMNRPDRSDILKQFSKPVLFVIGTEDKAVHLEDSLAQCYWPENNHVSILNGVAHMGMIEKPDEVTAIIKDFLKKLNPES